jgi:hypothetical protein
MSDSLLQSPSIFMEFNFSWKLHGIKILRNLKKALSLKQENHGY